RGGTRKWYLLSGLTIGLAASAKYTGALLIPILILAHELRSDSLRNSLRSLWGMDILAAVCIPGIVFILLNPFILLSFHEFYDRFSFLQYNVVTHGHLGVVSSESTPGFYLFHSLTDHLGIPFILVVVGTIVYFLLRRKSDELL